MCGPPTSTVTARPTMRRDVPSETPTFFRKPYDRYGRKTRAPDSVRNHRSNRLSRIQNVHSGRAAMVVDAIPTSYEHDDAGPILPRPYGDGRAGKIIHSMLTLGSVRIDPPLVLAPMAGITDHVYRLMLRRIGGVGLVTMEFISSEAITR